MRLNELLVEESWLKALPGELQKPYFKTLSDFLERESKGPLIYPPQHLVFNALNTTPFDRVKAVIIGQVQTLVSFEEVLIFLLRFNKFFFFLFGLGSVPWTWSSYGFVFLCA